MIFVAFPYSAYLLFAVASLYQSNTTATRYLIIAPTCDFLFTGILAAYILNRRMTNVRFSVSFLCFVAYFLYDFLEYNGNSAFNFDFKTKPGI